jgi:hypothetical protein
MSSDHYAPKWCKPSYSEEEREFARVSLTLEIHLDELREGFTKGELVDLPNWMWCSLLNTDSNDVFSLAEAEERAKLYNRDLSRVVQGMSSRSTIPAPIVLSRGDSQGAPRPYLMAGNTRLMACRVLNVRPKVWMMRTL